MALHLSFETESDVACSLCPSPAQEACAPDARPHCDLFGYVLVSADQYANEQLAFIGPFPNEQTMKALHQVAYLLRAVGYNDQLVVPEEAACICPNCERLVPADEKAACGCGYEFSHSP